MTFKECMWVATEESPRYQLPLNSLYSTTLIELAWLIELILALISSAALLQQLPSIIPAAVLQLHGPTPRILKLITASDQSHIGYSPKKEATVKEKEVQAAVGFHVTASTCVAIVATVSPSWYQQRLSATPPKVLALIR